MSIYKVFYKHKNQTSDNIYSVRVPVIGNDVEYAWRMSPLNVPNTIYIRAEKE